MLKHIAVARPMLPEHLGTGALQYAVEDICGKSDIVNITGGTEKPFRHHVER
jgi:hypothetical protein